MSYQIFNEASLGKFIELIQNKVKSIVDNATVASAQKATNDSDGNAINTTYRKVADSYSKTEIDTKLTGKADKATSLSGYGITDGVTKGGLDALLTKKANAATVVQTSLSSGGWSGGKYSFETQYPTNRYDITVEPDGDKITAEGYKAWGALKATGSINNVLIAKGKIPAVDIAVILRVVEKNA